MRQFLKEYLIEIIAAAAILIGIFLLVEPFDLRLGLTSFLVELSHRSVSLTSLIADSVIGYVTNLTPSDLTGIVLLSVAVVFIGWRVRYRILRSETLTSRECPRCGERIHRVHRSSSDRFLGAVTRLELRRYRCTSEQCRWSGLRLHESAHSSSSDTEIAPHLRSYRRTDESPTRPNNGRGAAGSGVVHQKADSAELPK